MLELEAGLGKERKLLQKQLASGKVARIVMPGESW